MWVFFVVFYESQVNYLLGVLKAVALIEPETAALRYR